MLTAPSEIYWWRRRNSFIMTKLYQPQKFEKKWQEYWQKEHFYEAPQNPRPGKKRYVMPMFPYPSSSGLHVGHVRIYTGTDILARFFRMKGYDVLHPIGFDAFGLPAENAAIKAKKNPQEMVPDNIANFKRQMRGLGFSYDWSRAFSTADPDYYRHTQWLFLQFFKLGLLYKKNISVYYCESCKTNLAEEEVLPDGTHERCGNPITRKQLPQWLFKITDYSDSLLKTLKDLQWPKGIIEMQKNWIGKSKGLNIYFTEAETGAELTVWTRYWETVFGATFLVVAPEHHWVSRGIKESRFSKEVLAYVERTLRKTDEQRLKEGKDKTGVFSGYYALNPANKQKIPIWIADYVLANVGTGAVMGVPSHDQRDFVFAKKYGLKIIKVISKKNSREDGLLINSKQFNGQDAVKDGKQNIAKWLIENKKANWQINYHLRDWVFSRQRYWGEPIPMVYCSSCAKKKLSYFDTEGYKKEIEKIKKTNPKLYQAVTKRIAVLRPQLYGWYPLEEKELPLELPYLKNYQPGEAGESPLCQSGSWLETKCPYCGKPAKRETDTMPNWAGSCWYFLRFPTAHITPGVIGDSAYLPVDWYLGGAEHAVLHLLYARFWMHILNDLRIISFREPFTRLKNVGMVLAEDHRKMSKSVGNVINPDEVIDKHGADSLRLYEMFMAPFSQEISWSLNNLLGAKRFLNKVYQLFTNSARLAKTQNDEDKKLVAKLQNTISKVERDITDVKFNTAISALMEFANAWQKSKLSRSNAEKYLKLLAPFCPFLAEEIWKNVYQNSGSIHMAAWPKIETEPIEISEIILPVTVNGKVRALLSIDNQTAESEAKVIKRALTNKKVSKYLTGKKYRYVYVPNKILNFITN